MLKKFIATVMMVVALTATAAVEAPLYEIAKFEDKCGLYYNGEICLYPIYDDIVLVEPFRQFWDNGKPYKVLKQQMHEISVGGRQNTATFGAYKINGKWGLMTMSKRLTDPVYDGAKVYRKLRTFKKTGDEIIAFAVVEKDGKFGVVDMKGKTLVPFIYSSIEAPMYIDEYEKEAKDKSNVFFKAKLASGEDAVIDITNNIIFNAQIPSDLEKELAKAEKKNNKDKARAQTTDNVISSLNKTYRELITLPLINGAEAISVCEPVGSTVFADGTQYGVKNKDGNIIIPALFDKISDFNDKGVATVTINDITGFVNEHGYISMPFAVLSFPGLVSPYEKTMNAFNEAFDVYPTNTYAWLAAADYLMNSSWAIMGGRDRDYKAALQCYDMALAMAEDRDEMYYFSENNLQDREKAFSNSNGFSATIEEKVEKSGWVLAADIFNTIANFSSTLNSVSSRGNDTDLDVDISEGTSSTSNRGENKGGSISSNRHGSISETTAMHSDDRTYCNYETQLIKMKCGNDEYKDSRRLDIQSKMKKIRKKWEGRGYNFYHSEMEDWGGI